MPVAFQQKINKCSKAQCNCAQKYKIKSDDRFGAMKEVSSWVQIKKVKQTRPQKIKMAVVRAQNSYTFCSKVLWAEADATLSFCTPVYSSETILCF